MTNIESNYLKVYAQPVLSAPLLTSDLSPTTELIGTLCKAFGAATGCPVVFSADSSEPLDFPHSTNQTSVRHDSVLAWSAPDDLGDGVALGHLRVEHDGFTTEDRLAAVAELAGIVVELVDQLSDAHRALRDRTSQLVVSGSVIADISGDCRAEGGERLEAIMRYGLASLDCQAAAVYLLDESTNHLQLRATSGFSPSEFVESTRPLEGSTADIEAMLGSTVVISSSTMFDLWQVPVTNYGAAICVPIQCSSTAAGTYWIFSDESREFTQQETKLLETLAGRLALDLQQPGVPCPSIGSGTLPALTSNNAGS